MRSALLFVLIMFSTLNSFASISSLNGSGTLNDPYLITNIDELKWMRDQINRHNSSYINASYQLTSDLDFSNESDWTPIAIDRYYPFKGTFDGNNKVIRNIKIGTKELPAEVFCGGLFGHLKDGYISSLGVEWAGICATVTPGYSYYPAFGGIVGYSNSGMLINCYSTGNISIVESQREAMVGGIIGACENAYIVNCYSTGNISSSSTNGSSSGGIVGYAQYVNIANCYSIGDVSSASSFQYATLGSTSYSGGIIGSCDNGNIVNCYSTGNINSFTSAPETSSSASGGIIGQNYTANISNCIALNSRIVVVAPSSGERSVGRIAGKSMNLSNSNYASHSIFMGIGSTYENITPITDLSGGNNGQNLSGQPINLLNQYVADNYCTNMGILLYRWITDRNANGELPVIDYNSPALIFDLQGTGDIDNPYLIYSYTDLLKVSSFINTYPSYSTKSYKLISDLDLSGKNDWIPIGTENINSFKGVFDGNNKVIRNIQIGSEEHPTELINCGFFGRTKDAQIINLGIEWTGLYSVSCYAGGIVGDCDGGFINNCYSAGTISSSLTNTYVNDTGGIAGICSNINIINSYSTMQVSSHDRSGGIVAFCYNSDIANCYATGDVVSFGSLAGGIVGLNRLSNITNCYSSANVSSYSNYQPSFSGGIAGNCDYNPYNISYCIALNGSIKAINSSSSKNAHAARISNNGNNTFYQNFANESVEVKTGTSDSDLNNIEITTQNDGENLIVAPITLLNDWVNNNSTSEHRYFSWIIKNGVNNNLPIFGEYPMFKVSFEANNGLAIEPIDIEYSGLITKPADPVREGYNFEGWHKDIAHTVLWDFDADRIYSNTTLYAKWNNPSSVDKTSDQKVSICVVDGKIVVNNASSTITIYNISGSLVRVIQQPKISESIDIECGTYIVKTSGINIKTMVKKN